MPARQIVNNCLDRDARSGKHRCSAHNVWRAGNNLNFSFGFHADNRSIGREFQGSRRTSELTGRGLYIQLSNLSIKLRNTLPALRSNELFGGGSVSMWRNHVKRKRSDIVTKPEFKVASDGEHQVC